MSGAVCGVLYALFAGQPLTIVGATGPLLIFESILYQICRYVYDNIYLSTNQAVVASAALIHALKDIEDAIKQLQERQQITKTWAGPRLSPAIYRLAS